MNALAMHAFAAALAAALATAATAQVAEKKVLTLAGAVPAAPPSDRRDAVTYMEAEEVSAAFARGAVLFAEPNLNHMVHASRRDAAGQAEVHLKDTDIICVLEGSVTFVTGGEALDGKTTARAPRACGSSRPMASTWAQSSGPSTRTTSPGGTRMPARST